MIRSLLGVAVVALVTVGVALGVAQLPGAVGDRFGDALSSINPFHDDGADRTGPPVLQSLTALSEFKAASGYYEVVVDLKSPNNLPDFLSGERLLYVGKGDVEAVVDFSELDERRVVRSDDGKSVTVTLPAPTVGEPKLNLRTSYVAGRDEGFLTRFRGSDIERKAQLEAVAKMSVAANGEGKLGDLAKASTTAMLRGLFRSLGYTNVTVAFDTAPAGRS